jgi:hypothetical protein
MLGKAARLDRETATIGMVQNCQRSADQPWGVLAGTPIGAKIGVPMIKHPSHGENSSSPNGPRLELRARTL